MMQQPNPFAQSPHYWAVRFEIPKRAAEQAGENFGDIALSAASFEIDEDAGLWSMELLFGAPPDMREVLHRLKILAEMFGIDVPQAETEKLPQQDWLANVARDFPPIRIGRFFVHGAHDADKVPHSVIPLQVEAGAAFGSGEHGTTHCCLEALNYLAKQRHCKNILDMGCGSGILAIAAAKLWKMRVLATDIDAVAVRVTKENAEINRVTRWVDPLVSDGYAHAELRRRAPYDLIVSNILARPLVSLAPKAAAHLAPGGAVVLSGLLEDQERFVASAYAAQHLFVKKRFLNSGWCTLLLTKGMP